MCSQMSNGQDLCINETKNNIYFGVLLGYNDQ